MTAVETASMCLACNGCSINVECGPVGSLGGAEMKTLNYGVGGSFAILKNRERIVLIVWIAKTSAKESPIHFFLASCL